MPTTQHALPRIQRFAPSVIIHGSALRLKYPDEPRDYNVIARGINREVLLTEVAPLVHAWAARKGWGPKPVQMTVKPAVARHERPHYYVYVPAGWTDVDSSELWERISGPLPDVRVDGWNGICSLIRGAAYDAPELARRLSTWHGRIDLTNEDRDFPFVDNGFGLRKAIKSCRVWGHDLCDPYLTRVYNYLASPGARTGRYYVWGTGQEVQYDRLYSGDLYGLPEEVRR